MLSPSSLEQGPYRVIRDVEGSDIEIDRLTPIKLKQPWHRKLADLKSTDLPEDWASPYEATCFAADNNALEVRSLERSGPTKIDEITPTSYLCVTVDGKHGDEGCYAAIRMHGKLIGSPSRAVSYSANPWEYPIRKRDTGYTYFFPLDDSMVGKGLEVVLLGMKGGGKEIQPSVWITAREFPFTSQRITISR